jgi:hypothetical protein
MVRPFGGFRAACLAIVMQAAAVGVSGCGGGGATSNDSTRPANTNHAEGTRLVDVRPTTMSGALKPGYSISARLNGGVCPAGAEAVDGAYDCTVGNEEYGPCWPVGKVSKVGEMFCISMPWSRSGTDIGLQDTLRPLLPVKPSERLIWGVELTSGQRCSPLRGAVSMFAGVPIDFSCESSEIELLGEPDKAQALWTIREVVAHRHKQAPLSHSAGPLGGIAVAWYGLGAAT